MRWRFRKQEEESTAALPASMFVPVSPSVNRGLVFCRLVLLRLRGRLCHLPIVERQGQLPLRPTEAFVRADDALYQVMPHHVAVLEVAETDAIDPLEDLDRFHQSRAPGIGQVDLGYVSGDDRLGI